MALARISGFFRAASADAPSTGSRTTALAVFHARMRQQTRK
jgi:hypothetical protein